MNKSGLISRLIISCLFCSSCGEANKIERGPSLLSPDGNNAVTLGYNIPSGTLEGDVWVLIHPVKAQLDVKYVRAMLRRCSDVTLRWNSNDKVSLDYKEIEFYLFESYIQRGTKLDIEKVGVSGLVQGKYLHIADCQSLL